MISTAARVLISSPRDEWHHRPLAEAPCSGSGAAAGFWAWHLGLGRNWSLGRFILAFIVFPSGQ